MKIMNKVLSCLSIIMWQSAVNYASADDSYQRVQRQTGAVCVNPVGEKGHCVAIRQCSSVVDLMKKDGRDPQVVLFLRRSVCGGDNKNPMICCPDVAGVRDKSVPKTTAATGTRSGKLKSMNLHNQPTSTPLKNNSPIKCGESTFKLGKKTRVSRFRVVGGDDADLGKWPWMVGLSYKYRGAVNSPPYFKCGATLISNQWVITAAHCLKGTALKDLTLSFARLGDVDLDDTLFDGAHPIDAAVDKIITHPQYSNELKQNDIALLHLKEPVEFTKNIHPICLLSGPKYRRDEFYAQKSPFITGWGVTGESGKSTTRLQEAQLKIVQPKQCADQFAKYVDQNLINEKVLCAGDVGKDACQGDSGGPLMFLENKTFYLGGIVAYGLGCNTTVPGVYTKVAEYIEWINENTGERF